MGRLFNILVFDWDGTLMNSQARIVASVQAAIADLGWDSRTHAEISHIIGLGLEEATLTLFPDASPEDVVRLRDAYREYFFGNTVPDSVLFDGVEEMLAAATDAGFMLAVATGKSRKGLESELVKTGLRRYFDATRCAGEAPSKPHPAMLEDLMDQLLGEPSTTLVIGDTSFDLEMAANAGAASVGVTWGVHSKARLLEYRPLACFDEVPVLSHWLTSLTATSRETGHE